MTTSTIYLVSCVKTKKGIPALAKDLYTSPRFRYMRTIAERQGDSWYILSARYHLVEPDQMLEPYELTLNEISKKEREIWASVVLTQLEGRVGREDTVVILAGRRYYELIRPELENTCNVVVPMEGLGMGKQLRWLKGQMSA